MNAKLNEEVERLRATDKRRLRETPNDAELEARIQELERENDMLRQTIQRDTGNSSKHGDNLDAKYDDLWHQKEKLEQELEHTRRNLEEAKSAYNRVDDTEVTALRAELIEAREIQEQRTQTISTLNRQIDDMRRARLFAWRQQSHAWRCREHGHQRVPVGRRASGRSS